MIHWKENQADIRNCSKDEKLMPRKASTYTSVNCLSVFSCIHIQSNPAISNSVNSKSPLFWRKIESVIYYQLFRTWLFEFPAISNSLSFPYTFFNLKPTPLFWTCQKQSTYIRAQLETYCILFELKQNIQRFFNATASADLSDI